jgi:hypothetical protein
MIRPTNITGQDLIETPNAKTTWPAAIKITKKIKHKRTPILSTKNPPKNGKMMLGIE